MLMQFGLCVLLVLQSGCTTIPDGENVAFRNETGQRIEALWVDDTKDLLVNGPLSSGEAVSVELPEITGYHVVSFFTEDGEMFRLENVWIAAGQTVSIALSEKMKD